MPPSSATPRSPRRARAATEHLIADALLTVAGACERAADWERAGELADEALALYRAAGDPYGVAAALAEQGWYDMVHGRLSRPRRASARRSSCGAASATTAGSSSR